MKIYRELDLREVIERLRGLPEDARVQGLDGILHSDRGWYDRSATAPSTEVWDAHTLATVLEDQIGKEIYGWKGGEYYVDAFKPVYVAEYGTTGPAIGGFEYDPVDDLWEPVGVEAW